MYSDKLHKAAPLSGNTAGANKHALLLRACYCFLSPHLCLPHKLRPTWTLTHTVSLYPEGASAAQWALKVKTEQIKVTVGGAQPATGHTIRRVCLCACVCKYFYLSNCGTSPERAPVKWLLSYTLTLTEPLRLRSTSSSLPLSCLRKTAALISSDQ